MLLSASWVTIMAAQDAFYTLPDSLISFVLSKIPIKDAVKSSILSKRWRFLYTQIPELSLSPHSVLGPSCNSLDPLRVLTVENIISNILLLHSGNLEGFHLRNTWLNYNQLWESGRLYSRQSVCKWVRYASRCNVKHLTLFHHNVTSATDVESILREIPPPALFSCSSLVTLYLDRYNLTCFPINFVGFPQLTSCGLNAVHLTYESLVSLLSLCPLLQNLRITRPVGLTNAVILSSTIENLDVYSLKSLSVKCPKLKELGGCMIEDLSVNGARFYELSYAIFEIKMQCASTLRRLYIDFRQGSAPRVVSASRFLQIVGNFQSLKELSIHMAEPFEREAEMNVTLLLLLHRLPNLQSLYMFGCFIQELVVDPIPDCLASPHVNLKEMKLDVVEFDYKEIAVTSCLLQSTPFLETMEIHLPDEYDGGQCMHFFKEILKLRRASSQAKIVVMHGERET